MGNIADLHSGVSCARCDLCNRLHVSQYLYKKLCYYIGVTTCNCTGGDHAGKWQPWHRRCCDGCI